MPDFTTGLIPGETERNFLPDVDTSVSLPPMSKPTDFPAFNAQGSVGSEPDFNDSMAAIFQKPATTQESFVKNSAPVDFNAKDMGAAMYKNAEQFKTYGLSLSGDNEETYGQLQTGWDRTKRALGGAWALGKNQFVEQLTSWGDTFNFVKDNKSAFEQSDMEEINKKQQEMQNEYHIFQTANDNATIFNWANVANTVQQSGYALGAIAEIIAEEAAMTALTAATLGGASGLQAAKSAANVASLGMMFKRVRELGEITSEVSRARKVFNSIQKINPFGDATLNFAMDAKSLLTKSRIAGESTPVLRTVGKGFGAFYRDYRALNMAVSEAKAEAAGVHQDLTNQLIYQYKAENGMDPDDTALNSINETAMKAAQTDGIWNTYLIMATNKIGIGNIMGGFKPLRALEETVGENILKLSDKAALKAGGGTKMLKLVDATENKWLSFKQSLVRKPLKYLKTNLTEALQENLQDVVKDGTQHYYNAKFQQDHGGDNPMKSMHNYMIDAGGGQFSVQGAKTFLSGFFTGAIIGPMNAAFGQASNIKQFVTDNKGFKSRQENIKNQRTETINNFNDIYNNPLTFGNKLGNGALQANFGELLKQYAKTNNKKGFNDIQDDATRHMILTGIQSGALDTLIDQLKDLPTKLNKEEFASSFGMLNTQKNIDRITNQIDNFAERAKEIKDVHEDISDKYKNPFNIYHDRFKGVDRATDPEYIKEAQGHMAWNDTVNNFVFMKDYYNQNIKRSVKMMTGLKTKPGFEHVAFNDIHLLTSANHIGGEIDMLNTEIKNTQGAPEAGTKKLLAQKRARVALLEKYQEHLIKWQEKYDEHATMKPGRERTVKFKASYAAFQRKAVPLFTRYVNEGLVNNEKPQVTKDNVDSAFVNLHDYMKAQKESGIVLDKINLLADPENFHTFFNDHNMMTRLMHHMAVLNQGEAEKNKLIIAEIEAKRKVDLDDLKKGIINPEYTGTLEEKEKQINEKYDKLIKDFNDKINGVTDSAILEAARLKEEQRVKDQVEAEKQAAEALIAAQKIEDDKKTAAQKILDKAEADHLAAIEAQRIKHEKELKDQLDIAERARLEALHLEKLAAIEKAKQDALAAHVAELAKAAAELEAVKEKLKKEAEERVKKEADEKAAAELTAKLAAEKAAEDAKNLSELQKQQAEAERLRLETEKRDKVLQDAVKYIATANEQELDGFMVDHATDAKMLSDKLIQDAYAARVIELKELKDADTAQQDKDAQYTELERIEREKLLEVNNLGTGGKKAVSAFSTTGQQAVDAKSKVLDPDPVKQAFYTTINKLKIAAQVPGVTFDNMKLLTGSKRVGVKITAVNPSKLFTESDGNIRLNELGKRSLEAKTVKWVEGNMDKFMQSTIFIITDNAGEPYQFDATGTAVDKGIVLTTNMRKPSLKDGVYFLKNDEGGNQLQTPEQLVEADLKGGNVRFEDPKNPLKGYARNIKLKQEEQQAEIKKLYDIRASLVNNTEAKYIIPITGITDGVIDIDYKDSTKLSSIKMDSFELKVITVQTPGKRLGGVYFNLPGYGKDILIVRPNISAEQADTIIELLINDTNPLNKEKTYEFLNSLVYTKTKDIWFETDGTKVIAKNWNGTKMIAMTPALLKDADFRKAFKNKLMLKKVNILNEKIGKTFNNITYSEATGFVENKMEYNDFIKDTFETFVQPVDGKVTPLNAYIKFDAKNTPIIEQKDPITHIAAITPELQAKVNEIKENSSFIKLNAEGTHYVNSKTGRIYERVTTFIQDKEVEKSDLLDTASALGTKIDNLVRDFFNGALQPLENYNISDVATIEPFIASLEAVKKTMDARGESVLANDITLYNDELGIAGTVDLLTYDQQGVFRIYDMKTMRGNNFKESYRGEKVSKYDSSMYGKPKGIKYQEQLSLYRILLNNTHGVLAQKLGVMPIEIQYKTGDTSTSVLKMLPGVTVNALDKVNTATLKGAVIPIIPIKPLKEQLDAYNIMKSDATEWMDYSWNFRDIGDDLNVPIVDWEVKDDQGEVIDTKFMRIANFIKKKGLTPEFVRDLQKILDEVNKIKSDFEKSQPVDALPATGNPETGSEKTAEQIQAEIAASEAALGSLFKGRGMDNIATPEQIQAAEQWWSKSPLSKFIPLERMMSVVNSNAIATWTTQGITLFNGANSTDIYHEAFHGFSQLYLTQEQKTNLYSEVRKIQPGLTDLKVEELLAEDFRKYVLSGGTMVLDQRPVRNTIWRKILNFLRELFTGVKSLDYAIQTPEINKIQSLYNKLYSGKLNHFSPSSTNAQFGKLNKGIELKDGIILSNSESMLVNETMDSLIATTFAQVNERRKASGEPSTNILKLVEDKRLRDGIYGQIKLKFALKTKTGTDEQKKLAQTVVDNYEAVVKYHISKSKYLKSAGIVAAYDEQGNIKERKIATFIDKEGNIQDTIVEGDDSNAEKQPIGADSFDKRGNSVSIAENASPEVIQLLSGLFAVDNNGQNIPNELGEPKLVPFKIVHNRVIKKLQGILDEKKMYTALLEASREYPELAQLANDLGNPENFEGNPLKFNLWMKMRQSYSLTRIPIHQMLIEKEENGDFTTRLIESRPDIQNVQGQFTSDFQSNLDRIYINVDTDGNNVLNVKKVLEHFTTQTEDKKGNILIAIIPGKEMKFLRTIGFNFTDKPLITAAINKIAPKLNFLAVKLAVMDDAGISITEPVNQLMKDTFDPAIENKKVLISKGENNNVSDLLEIEARNSDDYSNYSVVNPAGDKEWEHSLNNYMTIVSSMINDAESFPTYQDLIVEEDMYRFDYNRNPLVKNSFWLNSIFNLKTGERRKNDDGSHVTMNLINLSGVKEKNDNASADMGVKTSGLDMNGKHVFDYNSLLSTGVEELPRAEAKSTYFAISVSKVFNSTSKNFGYLYFPMNNFVERGKLSSDVTDYMTGSLIGELTRIGWLNEAYALRDKQAAGIAKDPAFTLTDEELNTIANSGINVDGYNKRGQSLTLFDDILSTNVKKHLLSLVKDGVPENLEELIDNDMKMDSKGNKTVNVLHDEFQRYFNNLEVENWKKIKDNLQIGKDVMDRLTRMLKENSQGSDKTTEGEKHRIINKAYTINSFVAKMEAYKMVYGDPAFYKLEKNESNKRIPAFGATKTTMSLTQGSMDYVNGKGRLIAESMKIEQKAFDGTLGVRIYKDISIDSEYHDQLHKTFTKHYKKQFPKKSSSDIKTLIDAILKPYTGMTESDAQGYITLDAYRMINMLQGEWPKYMEDLYIKEVNKEALTPAEVKLFFNVKKAQYAGPIKTEKLFVPAFHKFSLMPLIPSMIKGTKMDAVHKDMMEQGHDYATYESGSKIATLGEPQPFYANNDNKKRDINLSVNKDTFTTNTVFAKYLGDQLKIEPKWKEHVIFSTQMRKLLDSGFYHNGIPLDYKGKKAWKKLTAKEQENASLLHRNAEVFRANVDQLSALKKEELIREAKLEMVDGHYTIRDFGPLVQLIKKEFENREMPDAVIDFIDVTTDKKIKTSLDLSTQTQKIEGVIQSIINSRLIRQLVNGEPLIQLAGTGFEKFRNATDAEIAEYKSTNDLPYYQNEGRRILENDGKVRFATSAMKIKIALSGDYLKLLNLKHIDGKTIDVGDIELSRARLNECIRDEKWLDQGDNRQVITLTGTRIPVQSPNSMEFMEVYEFLPSKAGNIIIPASEIVAKSGSDFDVDKLSVFKANIAEDGTFIRSKYKSYAAIDKKIDEIKNDQDFGDVYVKTRALEDAQKGIKQLTNKEINKWRDIGAIADRDSEMYLNEFKDVLDSITYKDELRPYQNLPINVLRGKLEDLRKIIDIKDLSEVLFDYNIEIAKIEKAKIIIDKNIAGFDKTNDSIQADKAAINKKYDDQKSELNALFVERRNLLKSTENGLNQSIREILEMNEMFIDLVTPNSTRNVEGLADGLASRNIGYDPSVSKVTGQKMTVVRKGKTVPYWSATRLIEPAFNDLQFIANNSGKDGLGFGAIDNTFNNLFNKIGAYINNFYVKSEKKVPVYVHLNHNKMEGTTNISLSHQYDANNENKISDILSQLINGWVDVGKKAWIFDLNAGVESAPVLLLLNQIGTPIDDVANFMTQPVIQEYTTLLRAKRNLFAKVTNPENYKYFENVQRTRVLAPLLGIDPDELQLWGSYAQPGEERKVRMSDIKKFIDKRIAGVNKTVFTGENLKKVITSDIEKAALVYHYFQLEDIAKGLKEIKTSLNFDTNKAENSIAAQDKKNQFREAVTTGLLPEEQLYKLKDESVISSFAIQDFNIDFQEQLLPLRNNKLMNNFILAHKDDLPIDTRNQNFEKFGRMFKNDFISYLFQTHVTNKTDTDSWFIGINSIAGKLYKIKKENPELLVKYPLLTLLIKDKSKSNKNKDTQWSNIKMVDSALDTDAINVYHEQFTNLIDYKIMKVNDIDKNKALTKVFNQIARFGFLQSGLNKSPISWTEIIPQKLYTELMGKVIAEVTEKLDGEMLQNFYYKFQAINTGQFGFMDEVGPNDFVPMSITNFEPYRRKVYAPSVSTPVKLVDPKLNPKIISNADIARFNNYLSKSSELPNEFFTNETSLTLFYNNEMGKREAIPQSAIWMLNDKNLYDLIDKEGGEVYMNDIDLKSGRQIVGKSEKEAVKEVVKKIPVKQSTTFKNNGFILSTDKTGKDQGKADLANAFIGSGIAGSSTAQYRLDALKAGIPTNLGIKSDKNTIAFVSVNGNNKTTETRFAGIIKAVRQVLDAGGTIVMDNSTDAQSKWNRSGEGLVQKELGTPAGQTLKGYNYWGPNPEEVKKIETKPVTQSLFDPTDKTLDKGSVVDYLGTMYIFWNLNASGKAQLIQTTGEKYSGTPNPGALTVLGKYATTLYNNTAYIVTDKGNIYSGATGKLVYTGDDNSSKTQKATIIAKAKEDALVAEKIKSCLG